MYTGLGEWTLVQSSQDGFFHNAKEKRTMENFQTFEWFIALLLFLKFVPAQYQTVSHTVCKVTEKEWIYFWSLIYFSSFPA